MPVRRRSRKIKTKRRTRTTLPSTTTTTLPSTTTTTEKITKIILKIKIKMRRLRTPALYSWRA